MQQQYDPTSANPEMLTQLYTPGYSQEADAEMIGQNGFAELGQMIPVSFPGDATTDQLKPFQMMWLYPMKSPDNQSIYYTAVDELGKIIVFQNAFFADPFYPSERGTMQNVQHYETKYENLLQLEKIPMEQNELSDEEREERESEALSRKPHCECKYYYDSIRKIRKILRVNLISGGCFMKYLRLSYKFRRMYEFTIVTTDYESFVWKTFIDKNGRVLGSVELNDNNVKKRHRRYNFTVTITNLDTNAKYAQEGPVSFYGYVPMHFQFCVENDFFDSYYINKEASELHFDKEFSCNLVVTCATEQC